MVWKGKTFTSHGEADSELAQNYLSDVVHLIIDA